MNSSSSISQPPATDSSAVVRASNAHGQFHVHKLQRVDHDAVRKALKSWVAYASRHNLGRSRRIVSKIEGYLTDRSSQVHVCYSEPDPGKKVFHAIAVSEKGEKKQIPASWGFEKKPYLNLLYIASNPKDTWTSGFKRRTRRVAGAGKETVRHLAQKCLRKEWSGLTVSSENGAIGFYERLGFSEVPLDIEGEGDLMATHILHANRINQLFPRPV